MAAAIVAPGFADTPMPAFAATCNLARCAGWVAFNTKETFLDSEDCSGFPHLVKRMIDHDCLQLHRLERYRHHLPVEGKALHYYAIVDRKQRNRHATSRAGL